MKKYNGNIKELYPHNVVFAWTSDQDYDMERLILLEDLPGIDHFDGYVVLEGSHCSCFGFDETSWDAVEYSREELQKLSAAEYNLAHPFWQMVRKYI